MLTYEEAAAYLGIKVQTLYTWVHRKRVPHYRLGRRLVRFKKAELEAWVAASRMAEEAACT